MNILFYRNNKKTNKHGNAPIYLRLQQHGQRKEISTGIAVGENEFVAQRVTKHTMADVYNTQIDNLRRKLHSIVLDYENKQLPYNVAVLMNALLQRDKKQMLLTELIVEYDALRATDSSIKLSTVTRDRACNTVLQRYLKYSKQQHVALYQINNQWANNYIDWLMLQERGGIRYNNAVVNKFRSYLQRAIRYAASKDYVTHNLVSASKVLPQKKKAKVSLNTTELALWSTYLFASVKLQQVADMFTFQCLTGFDYGCLCTFDYALHTHVTNGITVISKPRAKNGQTAFLPLHPTALTILVKYNYKLPIISGQNYNLYLRECAQVVGITQHLTSHVGRKTFANISVNYKIYSIDTASKMLGHNNINTTQKHYVNVNEDRVLAEYQSKQAEV